MRSARYTRLEGASESFKHSSALLPAAHLQSRIILRDGKLQFVCGAFSILLAVLCAVVVAVIVDRAPQLFMNMGEVYMGQNDLQLFSDSSFLNYTLISEILAPHGARFQLHSPRYQINVVSYAADRCRTPNLDPWNAIWKYNQSEECKVSEVIQINDWECGINETMTVVSSADCFDFFCQQAGRHGCRFNLIDSELEKQMGYGREWNLPPLEPNEVYIDFRVAASLGISVNDTIYVRIPGWSFYEVLLLPDGMDIWYTARVAEVISSPMGKSAYTDIDPLIFAEYKHFLASLTDQLESVFAVSYLRDYDLYEYAQRVKMNMPAEERVVAYETTDFAAMRLHVFGWVSQVCYYVGLTEVDPDVPIMFSMQDLEWAAVGFKILLLLVTSVQFMLCVLVIYSLLSAYREVRVRESAILRMIGLPRYAMSVIVAIQALVHSMPGWLLGLGVSVLVLHSVFRIFSSFTGLNLYFGISSFAFLVSTIYGVLVPLMVGVVIVGSAMRASIVEGLQARGPVKAVVYTIARATEQLSSGSLLIIAIGGTCLMEGFTLLYAVPGGYLSGNYATLIFIFVVILVSTLIGLAMLATAVQPPFERFLVILFLWEGSTVRSLVTRNLSVHRSHNRLTAISISVSVSMVVFISSVVNAQLGSMDLRALQVAGSPITVALYGTSASDPRIACLTGVLANYSEFIAGSAWRSTALDITLSTPGRVYSQRLSAYTVPENFYDTQYMELLRVVRPSGVPISALLDDLYAVPTASLVTGSDVSAESAMGASIGDLVMVDSGDSAPSVLYSIAAMLSSSPLFSFSSNPVTSHSGDALTSVPAYMRMLRKRAAAEDGDEWDEAAFTVEDLPLDAWHLRLHSSVSSLERRCFFQRIQSCGWSLDDFESRNTGTTAVQKAFQMVSFVAIFIVISICLSSLVSATIVSVHQQAPEIGLLQALGLNRAQLYRVYLYETVVLVFIAGLLGGVIGVGLSWLIVAQQQILQDQPVAFSLPGAEFAALLVSSVLMAAAAVLGPVRSMLGRPIVSLLRGA